ncbi:magnesium chelatase subunit D family protein [PVC group bacterium]|nr:magnesium chelatase subunit D family protein [PVC group bacterium]
MKKALILNAITPKVGGVLIRGTKGTAKSTAARALADLLPEIDVVADCPFVCDPHDEKVMCDACRERSGKGEDLPIRTQKMLVINMPVSATEDRVVGTLDFERALKEGLKALEPGILAEANRGILYIDEVNLLDDHVADALLDAAAMGVNVVEREGISVSHPSRFILIGTMNPEEGELRPQLLDRFGFCVNVEGLTDLAERVEIVERRERFELDPAKFKQDLEHEQQARAQRILDARERLPDVRIERKLVELVSSTCLQLQVDGHRADIVIVRASKAIAAFDGRDGATQPDVEEAMALALPHRMRRMPFEPIQPQAQEIRQALDQAKQERQEPESEQEPQREEEPAQDQTPNVPREQTFDIANGIEVSQVMKVAPDRKPRTASGRSADTASNSRKGRYVRPRLPRQQVGDVAIDATLRQAAANERTPDGRLKVRDADIREKQRKGKASMLVLFVVDGSGSMGVNERMAAAKGAVFALLGDIYKTKDRVALLAFRGEEAVVVLPPCRSTDLAAKRLADIPTGGKTPLPAGIVKAVELAKTEMHRNENVIPLLVFLTDGRANVPLRSSVSDDLAAGAEEIKRRGIRSLVIDTETGNTALGMAKQFADQCQAQYHHLDALAGDRVAQIVRSSLQQDSADSADPGP